MRQPQPQLVLGWPLRIVRSLVLSGLTLVLGMGAHSAAGAPLPPVGLLIICLSAIWAVVLPLARVRLTLPRILTVVIGGQLGTHMLLEISTTAGAHHDMQAPSWTIVAAHTIAAGLVAIWLALGEQCLWSILTLLSQRMQWIFESVAALVVVDDRAIARLVLLVPSPDPVRKLVRAKIPIRRGPPVLSVR